MGIIITIISILLKKNKQESLSNLFKSTQLRISQAKFNIPRGSFAHSLSFEIGLWHNLIDKL